MASIDATIDWLEKLPNDIAEKGREYVRDSIISNGHYDTGNMFNQVQAAVHGTDVHIRVWAHYAAYVNDGHGGADPGHIMGFKDSPKWPGPIHARRVRGYGGSGFFDRAAEQLRSYIYTL